MMWVFRTIDILYCFHWCIGFPNSLYRWFILCNQPVRAMSKTLRNHTGPMGLMDLRPPNSWDERKTGKQKMTLGVPGGEPTWNMKKNGKKKHKWIGAFPPWKWWKLTQVYFPFLWLKTANLRVHFRLLAGHDSQEPKLKCHGRWRWILREGRFCLLKNRSPNLSIYDTFVYSHS